MVDLKIVADSIMNIANEMPETIKNAIFTGYTEAVKAFCGFGGEVTINTNAWKKIDGGSEKATSQIKMPGVGENDVVIFSPKTAEDRRMINYMELFISPIISVQDVENDAGESSKVGVIDVSCERGNADSTPITLVYSVMRTSMATIQNSTTENPDDGDNTDGSGDQDGGLVEVPIEED